MKIAIVDTLGLTYDGTTLDKRGLGGSESAVILMSKELVKLGFDVTVFNDCTSDDSRPGVYHGVAYKPLHMVEHNTDVFDVMIASRSVAPFAPVEINNRFKSFIPLPNFTNLYERSRYRVLWMHDTFCDGDDLVEQYVLDGRINEIFVLSDFHNVYVTTCNHGQKRMFETLKRHMFITRNGIVRYHNDVDISAKDRNLFVYNASVTKGLRPLLKSIWPRIKNEIPQAKLTVIGGYYRFREGHQPDAQEVELHQYIEQYPDINFTGVIKQSEVADILAKASFMIYPADFPETFGISTLESLAYNTPLLTCDFGALEETAIDSACYKIAQSVTPSNVYPHINEQLQCEKFAAMVIQAYNAPYIHQQKMYACNAVKDVCGWDTVALQWKQHLYHKLGKYMRVDQYRAVKYINHRVRKVFGRRFTNSEENVFPAIPEQMITVVVPVYNSEKYISTCIESIAAQDYHNYRVLIIDDASTDATRDVVCSTLATLPEQIAEKFTLIKRETNVGAVRNQWEAIKRYGEGIIILIDGDDWLVNDPTIFHQYNYYYSQGVEFTYGSCHSLADNIDLIAQPYPADVKANKSYRQHRFNWNIPYTHLRTFSKQLFDKLTEHDVLVDGQWPKAGGDTALFYSLIEAADPDKILAITDVNYIYNDLNPINDYKVNSEQQTATANKVIQRRPVTDKFSVVVPTMWKYPDFISTLDKLLRHPEVGEVVLINNSPKDTLINNQIADHPKLRHVTYGYNIGVNPAWNVGVQLSTYDNICIVNDDVDFDLDVLPQVRSVLERDSTGVIGVCPGLAEYNQPPHDRSQPVQIVPWTGMHTFGFGCLMFVSKKRWNVIPEQLKYYYGDYFIFDKYLSQGMTNYTIHHLDYYTPYAQTCTSIGIDVDVIKKTEGEEYNKIRNTMGDSNVEVVPYPKKTMLIAVPTNKYIEPETFKSIYDLDVPENVETTFQFFYGYQIDQIRNLIAEWGKQFDYLFCVDSDIVLPKDTITKFIDADKDIISGVYRQRLSDRHVIEIYDRTPTGGFINVDWDVLQQRDRISEIGACGFGCVLIKANVLRTMEYPHFVYKSALNHANTFSEDVYFCMKAREAGFTVWCDRSVVCEHIGQCKFIV